MASPQILARRRTERTGVRNRRRRRVVALGSCRGGRMKFLTWIGIAMVICWAILWLGIKMAVTAVHLLLLLGAVLIVWGLVRSGRSDAKPR
jgi:hypothetical protein